MRDLLRVTALTVLVACVVGCRTGAEAGDAASAPASDRWAPPPAALPERDGRLALETARPLPGAGAVAFHPLRRQLAWAGGETLFLLDLERHDALREIAIGHWISDLGFSPDGDLWLVAGTVQRWRDGTRACQGPASGLERLLAADAAGASAARAGYEDGIGPLQHRVRLDRDCRVLREDVAPHPPQEAGDAAPALPGELPWRIDDRQLRLDAMHSLALPAAPVAVSPDGRWWVFGEDGRRRLHALTGGR